MGITTKQITIATCDLCGDECGQEDGEVCIKVNNGDGRDVGPAYIHGRLTLNAPYQCVGGLICIRCKAEWLRRYADDLTRQQEAAGHEQ